MSDEYRERLEKQKLFGIECLKILEEITDKKWCNHNNITFSYYASTFICSKIEALLKTRGIWCASGLLMYEHTFRPPMTDNSYSRILVQSHYMEVYLSRGIILVSDLGL